MAFIGDANFVLSVVRSTWLGLFIVLNGLNGSGSSESFTSGLVSHCDATVAPTCFDAGWSFPHADVGEVNMLHLFKKAHSVPFVQLSG